MKNVVKVVLFVFIFIVVYIAFSYLSLPKNNLFKYGLYNTSMYEILGEKKETIDTIIIGDSLVYSSVSPMDIYGEYGYTVFDCSEPAQLLSDGYNYYKIAVDSQKPKVVFIEANMLFRDSAKKPWYNKPLKIIKNSLPLITYHSNWKKLFINKKNIGAWTNTGKGYKKNTSIKSSTNHEYMIDSDAKQKIPKANYYYIEQIIKDSEEKNIKLIFIGLPSQKSWNMKKHNKMIEMSNKYNITYINLNDNKDIDIDWTTDTKDKGDHLNDNGAKKVSKYLGEYLSSMGILEDHREDIKYQEWNQAYKYYKAN